MKPKILIVEDEITLSTVLKNRFEAEGLEVIVAKDGEKALRSALKEKPNLILLDIVIPGLSGLSMLKQLRSHSSPANNVPVIVLTNLNDSESVKEALAHGAHDILVKADWTVDNIVKVVKEKLNVSTNSA